MNYGAIEISFKKNGDLRIDYPVCSWKDRQE